MKYTFEDLNSFVDGRLSQLCGEQERFFYQAYALGGMYFEGMRSRAKLRRVYSRLQQCKLYQQTTDSILNSVEKSQNQWEEILGRFEDQCQCECTGNIPDQFRAPIYQLADTLFATLQNCHQITENIESKVMTYKNTQKTDSIHLLFEVIEKNLRMLEKLYLYIQKLQTLVNYNEYMKSELFRTCYCR